MRIFTVFTFFSIGVIGSLTWGSGLSFKEWCYDQVEKSPTLKLMAENGCTRRAEEARQLNQLKDAINAKIPGDISLDDLVKTKLKQSTEEATGFLSALSTISAGEKGWPLRSTKTKLNFELALEYIEKNPVESLLTRDFTADLPKLVYADVGTRHDTSEGRAIKTILTVAWQVVTEKALSDLSEVFGDDWMEKSPFYLGLPLPKTESPLGSYSWVINYKGRPTLVEPHNGFAFGGGHGDEILGELAGQFPVFDCSSIVARYSGLMKDAGSVAPSTLHWLLYGVESVREDARPFGDVADSSKIWSKIISDWKTQDSDKKYRDPLVSTFNFLTVTDVAVIQLGDIWVRRFFNRDKIEGSTVGNSAAFYGAGGHVGVVLGIHEGNIVFMSANRSMKEIAGRDWDFSYAIETRQLEDTSSVDYFFRKKDAV